MKRKIEELQKEVEYWKHLYSRTEADLSCFVKAIRDASGEMASSSRESIIERVARLCAYSRFVEGQEVDVLRENRRLWYMLRVVLKDPQLSQEETKRHDLINLNTNKDQFPA